MFIKRNSSGGILYYREAPPIPIITDGLILNLDAQNLSSYPGSGVSWYDLTENANTASLQNISFSSTPTYNQKKFDFNGSNSVAVIPEKSNFNTQTVTVELWAKTANLNQNGFFFEKGNVNTQYSIFQAGSSLIWRLKLNGGINDLQTNSSVLVGTENFAQIVASYSNGNRKMYVNGSLVASDGATGVISTDTNGISIGAYGGFNGSRGYFYTGSIAIVRVYNKQLNDAEVLQNYKALEDRYLGKIITVFSGSSSFTGPTLADGFEYSDNWNETIDILNSISGSSNFISPSLSDGFEVSDNWDEVIYPETIASGSSNFTGPTLEDGFEASDNWPN